MKKITTKILHIFGSLLPNRPSQKTNYYCPLQVDRVSVDHIFGRGRALVILLVTMAFLAPSTAEAQTWESDGSLTISNNNYELNTPHTNEDLSQGKFIGLNKTHLLSSSINLPEGYIEVKGGNTSNLKLLLKVYLTKPEGTRGKMIYGGRVTKSHVEENKWTIKKLKASDYTSGDNSHGYYYNEKYKSTNTRKLITHNSPDEPFFSRAAHYAPYVVVFVGLIATGAGVPYALGYSTMPILAGVIATTGVTGTFVLYTHQGFHTYDPETFTYSLTETYPQGETNLPLIIKLSVHNPDGGEINISKISIPGVGTFEPRAIFQPEDIVVKVEDANGQVTKTYLEKGVDNDEIISTVMGDQVTFHVPGIQSPIDIEGVPSIWLSGFAAKRRFICEADTRPGEYTPYIPWESHTHYKAINQYPDGFMIKRPDWEVKGAVNEWSWIAQRRTDPNKNMYQSQVEFPRTKGYNWDESKTQRENQTDGWFAEWLHYWNNNVENGSNTSYSTFNESPAYSLGMDGDEYLYPTKKIDTNNNLLKIPEYSSNGKYNWLHMWDEEKLGTGSGNDLYSYTYDDRGFPSGGFLLNDYITAYRKFKETENGNANHNTYFSGYEIEDHRMFRRDSPMGSAIVRSNNKPGVCARNCYFNPHMRPSENKFENNQHPGKVKITSADGAKTLFHLKVKSPQATDHGFHGSIKGTQWPMTDAYTDELFTYNLVGLPTDMSKKESDRYSLEYEYYASGKGTTLTESNKNTSQPVYDKDKGTLSRDFAFTNGWGAIVAYYDTGHGKVIIAGRDIQAAGLVGSLTAPGSTPEEMVTEDDDKWADIVASDNLDLKEGRGERVNESIEDLRSYPQEDYYFEVTSYNPITSSHVTQYSKYWREYVVPVGTKLSFSAVDVGRTWSREFDPYTPWSDIARAPHEDSVAKALTYELFKLNQTTQNQKLIREENNTRYFENVDFSEPGQYLIKANFMNSKYPGQISIKVKDYPNSDQGTVYCSRITDTEIGYLHNMSSAETGYEDLYVCRIDSFQSKFLYQDGLRDKDNPENGASFNFNHRFSKNNGYWDEYYWTIDNEDYFDQFAIYNYFSIGNYDPQDEWPESWQNQWVRHMGSGSKDATFINESNVINDPANYSTVAGDVFSKLSDQTTGSQQQSYQRWLPWISYAPSRGYRIDRWVKTITDLEKFFNGSDGYKGAWTGQEGSSMGVPPKVTNALEWFDTNSTPTTMTDNQKNALELYYDLKYGRKVLSGTDLSSSSALKIYQGTKKFWVDRNGIPNNSTNSLSQNNYLVYSGSASGGRIGEVDEEQTITVDLDGTQVLVYPNPASEIVFIDIQGEESGTMAYRLVDLNGTTVMQGTWEVMTAQRKELLIGGLAAGIYVLELETSTTNAVTKLLLK
ncbi:MAG: T9SS type A sorting domain-containing protein [Reichenbachiella sp.]|uniref:T9SS type A sorting domain-containing protein n=1 Tax=Reichenbachiella sp. TaxID=2184521 RepID=UPI003265AD8D